MIERLAKIQADAQVVKIQNNIQSNNDITSAEGKDKCRVVSWQTYDVKSLSV